MTQVPIPSPDTTGPVEEVAALLQEEGQLRLSEIREEIPAENLGNALLELVKRGEVGIFPVGEVVLVKPER